MSTSTAQSAATSTNGSAPAAARPAETSEIGRVVALLTPVFAVAAAWVAGAVAQLVPGAHLDQTQLVALMVTAATTALGAAWKWLHGWQQHEFMVAEGKAPPLHPRPARRRPVGKTGRNGSAARRDGGDA